MAGSRRAKGEGSWRKLPSGKWQKSIRSGAKEITASGATKTEASENLKAKLLAAKNGAPLANAQSFTTFARAWLLRRQKKCSPTTLDTEGYWVNSLEADPLGKKLIAEITDADLRAWKVRQKMANSTLRNRCIWLNQLLHDAGSDARAVVPSRKRHARRPLSPEERVELLTRLQKADPKIRLAAMLCWRCGLRRSEACGLRHEDIDGDGFWVRQVAVLAKGKIVVKDKAKNPESHGWVPLPSSLKDLVGGGKGYVLGEGNVPMNPKVLSNRLGELAAGMHIPSMGTHALRRTYGMMLLESGADIITAAESMRHDAKTLAGEYARSRRDLKRDAVDRAFGGS